MASSAQHALTRERRSRPDEVFVDDNWVKDHSDQLESAIGFEVDAYEPDEFYEEGMKKKKKKKKKC